MSVLPILTLPDARLRRRAAPVDVFDPALNRLADDLLETMYHAKGRGLAATQVGAMVQMFVMDMAWKDGSPDPMVFVQARVVRSDPTTGWKAPTDTAINAESCLSIPDRTVRVERPAFIRLVWNDLAGRDCQCDFTGFDAVCVQHEIDHLDGVLCIDYPDRTV